MVLAPSVAGLFKWRQFEPEMILLAVGWYLRFSLSYRDVEELLAERGLLVDHVTVWRWVQRYAPEIQRRLRPRLRPTNDSWRVDETYIRVKGKWVYLYRAVDSSGATIDFLLSAKRDAAAAERFLAKALRGENHPAPRVINTDEHAGYPPAIVRLKAEEALEENCRHRPVQYLNNVLEQDHRPIKRRVRASQHFRSFWGAWRTIAGYENDSYDPQRPSVSECGGCEGRSTAPLHSRSVRCDELNYRSSTPTFGSTTKLQHIPLPYPTLSHCTTSRL
jgi:transposase, IS6 family